MGLRSRLAPRGPERLRRTNRKNLTQRRKDAKRRQRREEFVFLFLFFFAFFAPLREVLLARSFDQAMYNYLEGVIDSAPW
jgi:hypothetical protein